MNAAATKTRVLIVDDSPTVLEYLTHMFNATGKLEVIGTARNGREAIEFVSHTRPDIITMDINMPVMNGLEATRAIMCTDPIPIVILSASWKPEEVLQSFSALDAGALASFAKPGGMRHAESAEAIRELVLNIEALARIKLVRRQPLAGPALRCEQQPGRRESNGQRHRNPGVVVIGVSTGGPPVLQCILEGLVKDFRFPVLIVQHISRGFSEGLVDWLHGTSALPVALARHGDPLRPGFVALAPDDCHMCVGRDEQIVLSGDAPEQGLRPAVSRLFESAASVYGKCTIAVMLTGMGSDGASQMLAIKEQGGVTIAQDEHSCVVYGMPRAAIQMNAIKHVLSPFEIVSMLNRLSTEGEVST